MADQEYPIGGFHFTVNIFGEELQCAKVSGLGDEVDEMEYRHGADESFSMKKLPGLRKSSAVTCEKAIFKEDNRFSDWFSKVTKRDGSYRSENVIITLKDETHQPVTTWTLTNAWVKKITPPSMDAKTSEVALEQIELVHEGIVENFD